ncbi:MAG: nucleoside phosphorylase [Roseivirga sp.]|nr:nucleoside phosphorylase [Roseivirga sp.]
MGEIRIIPESELILVNDRVYHLNLHPEQVAETIIVVGDPDRVPMVSAHFDKIDFQVGSRELVTHTGWIGSKRLSVISSGMGTDNVELLMTELDALFNVDLTTRTVKKDLTKLEIIRIGTSGCLQADIPLDALLVSKAALGLDTLMHFYKWTPDQLSDEVTTRVQEELRLSYEPYFAEASQSLLAQFSDKVWEGVTITCPGFYAPQGRAVRLQPRIGDMLDTLATTTTPLGRFTNFEMETAGYYAMGRLLGHEMLSLNALIANRGTKEFSETPAKAVDHLIQTVLGVIA